MSREHTGSKRRTFLKRAALVGGVVAGGSAAPAAASGSTTRTVDPVSGPYHTISDAVRDAADGDTIEVAGDHVYNESVQVPPSRGLTFIGVPGDDSPGPGTGAPTLEGPADLNAGFVLEGGGGSTPATSIDGFEIRNYGSDVNGDPGNGVIVDARSNVTLRNLHVHDIAGSGIQRHYSEDLSVSNFTVRNCAFRACANWAVSVVNIDGVTLAGNHVEETTTEVSDQEDDQGDDVWWEEDSVDGNPQGGFKVEAHARMGNSGRTSEVLLEDNRIDGPYDDGAVRLFSYHFDESDEDVVPGDANALLTGVTVRNNHIDIGDGFDNEALDEHGILLDANASSHGDEDAGTDGDGADRPVSPARIEDVSIHDNVVEGAGNGYQVFSMAPVQDDPLSGTVDVRLLDNVARNCEVGVLVSSFADGGAEDVTVDGLTTEHCDIAAIVGGFGIDGLRDVTVSDVTDLDPGVSLAEGDQTRFRYEQWGEPGIVVVGRFEDAVDGVSISGYAPPNRPIGIWLRAVAVNAVENVHIAGCTFDGLDTGVRAARLVEGKSTRGATGEGFSDVRITESTFLDNATGFGTESPGGRIKTGNGLTVHRSDFVGNDVAVDNADGGGVVTAECNFWGHATGPTHPDNRPGQGDAVTDGVDYAPWIPRSFETVPEEACHVGQQHD